MYQEDSFKTSQVVYAHTRSDEADMEYKMHCHNSYEIYYMVKGNVEYFLEGTSYIPKPGEPTEQQTRWTARMMDTQSALKWSLMRNVPVLQSLWSICLKSSTRTA